LLSAIAEVGQVIHGLQHRFSSSQGTIIKSLLTVPEIEAAERQVPIPKE
jgi:hypothetical protein